MCLTVADNELHFFTISNLNDTVFVSLAHIMDFLIKHKLINSSQHGFLKSKSCLTNLLCFFEEITKWVDEGSPVDIIYLDFQKAFYKVGPTTSKTNTQVKIPWYRNQYNKLDRTMAYRQKTESSG